MLRDDPLHNGPVVTGGVPLYGCDGYRSLSETKDSARFVDVASGLGATQKEHLLKK